MNAIRCMGLVVAGMALAAPLGAAEIWRSDAHVSTPPTLDLFVPAPTTGKPAAAVAFAADGDVVYGALAANALDVEVVRVRADGGVRWRYSLDASASPQTITALLADADGGATFALADPLYDDRFDLIVHVDASGQTGWTRALPTGWLVRLPSGRIASAGYAHLGVLDASNGNVVWQRTLSRTGSGDVGGLAADASNLYVSSTLGDGIVRTRKYDAAGELQWEAATPGGGGVVAAGQGKVYVRGGSQLHALDAAEGRLAWSSSVGNGGIVRLSADAVAEPVVSDGYAVARLAAADGRTRWSTPVADIRTLDVVGDALLVATSSTRARLDPDSGTIVWNVAYADGPRLPLGVGARSGSEARSLSRPIAAAPGVARAIDERIDLANGEVASSVQVAAIEHGVDSASVLDGEGRVFDAGVAQDTDGPHLLLRALDGTGGGTLWQVDDAIAPPGGAFAASVWRAKPAIAIAGDTLAVAQVIADGGLCSNGAAWIRVAAHARADGTRRWASWLRDADAQGCPYASEPVVDHAGGVFVSVVTLVACQPLPGLGCQRRTLYKFAAADGSVLWRHDEAVQAGAEGLVFSPHRLSIADDDVVVGGGFVDAPATALRVSGANGSIVWESHVFDGLALGDAVDRLGDGSFVAYAGDDVSYSWARLDAATGTAAWTSTAPWVPCYGAGCSGFGTALFLPDDDKLVPVQRDYAPWLRRQHNDGSGLVDEWMLGDASPILSSWVRQVLRDPSGQLHVYLRRGHRFSGSVSFLAALDAQGNLLGQQAFHAYDGAPVDAWSYPEPLAMPAPDRVLARTYAARPPLPTTSGVALYDTSVTAHGNLALALDTDRTQVAAGAPLAFHLHVTYAGDAPITGARLVANLPWASGIGGATCVVQSGSGCVLDTRSGNLRATFDLAPGGTVDVSGSVRVLDAATEKPAITATTYGAMGLSEVDTIDNFARANLLQSLFLDGFDAD